MLGHNGPPDAIDEINAAYEQWREEAENWADGEPVSTKEQMEAVDALRAKMRDYRLDLERGQKAATAPLYAAYKAEGERWKPTIEDVKKIEGCLVATVDTFKRKLAEEQKAKERAAWEEAERKRKEAEALAAQAGAANLEDQRAAEEARRQAVEAEKSAQGVSKEGVKGLRTVTRHEILDMREAVNWIAKNDKDAMAAFAEEYVAKNRDRLPANIVRVWKEKEAF